MSAAKGEAPVIGLTEASISNQTYQRKTDMTNFNASNPSPATAEPLTTVNVAATAATTALVPVFTGTLQGQTVQLCDARTLHAFMAVLRDFTDWIKGRIRKFGFVEGFDFAIVANLSSPEKGSSKARAQKLTDYHMTLDMAKELSMVENNAKGREARRYFMECEKQVLAALSAHPGDRIAYAVNPTDTLSAAQAEQLRLIFKEKCDTLPKDEQAGFMTKGWSKLKSHFGCTYRNIQQREFSEALSLATRHAAEWNAVGAVAVPPVKNALQSPPEPDRTTLAFKLASEAATQVQRSVFDAIMAGNEDIHYTRWLLALGYDRSCQTPTVPQVMPIDRAAHIASMEELATRLESGDMFTTNIELANLMSAGSKRLAQRMQYQSSQKVVQT